MKIKHLQILLSTECFAKQYDLDETMKCVMSFLVFGLGLLKTIAANNTVGSPQSLIPSKTEQANLLLNVQEVFEQVKLLTIDETRSTNVSVVQDIELMVSRAEYVLDLLQQIMLFRLSCDGNAVCSLDAPPTIKQLAQEGKAALRKCTLLALEEIAESSDHLANVTHAAIDRGQVLLDDLGACSRKLGLRVITCYKGIIATDVVPVKHVLLGAVETHRVAHFKALEVRRKANSCLDDTVARFRDLMEESLQRALRCNL